MNSEYELVCNPRVYLDVDFIKRNGLEHVELIAFDIQAEHVNRRPVHSQKDWVHR